MSLHSSMAKSPQWMYIDLRVILFIFVIFVGMLIFSKTECWHCSNRRDLARLLVDSNPGPLTQWEPILLTYIRPSAWLTVPSETLRNFESSNPSLYGMESLRTGGLKERRGAYKLAVMMFSLRYFKRLKQKNEQAFFYSFQIAMLIYVILTDISIIWV